MKGTKNIILNISILFSFAILFLIFILIFNVIAIKYFERSKIYILNEFRNASGFELSYEKVFPNIIGSIRIYEVKIDDHLGTSLSLGDIDLEYSLLSFFKNRDNPFSIIKKITLKSFKFSSNKDELVRIAHKFKKKFGKNTKSYKSAKNLIPKNLTVELKDGRIRLNDNVSYIKLDLLNLKVVFDKNIRIDSLINFDLDYSKKIAIKTNLKLSGELKDLQKISSNFNVDFKTLNINEYKLKRQKFIFENSGLNVKLIRLKDTFPLLFNMEKDNDILNISLRSIILILKNI